MFRKNQSHSSSGRKGFGTPSHRGQKKSAPQQPKQVSPNYRVSMMHHQTGGQQGGQYSPMQKQRYHGGPPQDKMGFDRAPSAPHARKGFTNVTVEMKEELHHSFKEKLRQDDMTVQEVINRLIEGYTLGTITLPSQESPA